MAKLSSGWRWVGRVAVWDVEQDRRKREAAAREKSAVNAEHLAEQRRLNDVRAKTSRLLADCDLLVVPQPTLFNVARGAYLSHLGNTPGHLNHWSKVGFHSLLTRHGTVLEVRTPLPWTLALVGLD